MYAGVPATAVPPETVPSAKLPGDGAAPAVLNAANEVAVQAFLEERIGFTDIARINAQTMNDSSFVAKPSYEDYVAVDTEARRIAAGLCKP